MTAIEKLIQFLDSISPVSDPMKRHLEMTLKRVSLNKGDYLLKAGAICKKVCFIETGLVRGFHDNNEKEISVFFLKENDIVWSLKSFVHQVPSEEYIQALEDTTLYYLSYDELEYCYKHFEGCERIGRLLIQHYYIQTEEKFKLREARASERFKLMGILFPGIIGRVPDKYIYSYLGIESATLKRIKRNYRFPK